MKRNTLRFLAAWLILVQLLCLMPQLPVMAEAAATTETTLVAGNTGWSFFDGNADKGTEWRGEGFDDSTWKTGNAPLGYPATDNNPIFGAISGGTLVASAKSPNAYITYYFRKSFEVTNASAITGLNLTVGLDDGYVMYLNGQEIRRTYVDAGAVTWQTTANYINEPSNAQGTDIADVTTAALPFLKNGTNTLAVEMHNRDNNSSDIYFDMKLVAQVTGEPVPSADPTVAPEPSGAPYGFSGLTLQLGATADVMNFSWISAADATAPTVAYAKKTDMTGDAFPSSQATQVHGTSASAAESKLANKATLTGLLPSTEYVYRIGNGTNWSATYSFETGDAQNYSFVAVGDPQIGSSGVAANTAGWADTVNKALTLFPETDFILSAGDQVNTATSESEYAGFLSPDALKSVPVMPVAGNHDNAANYVQHFTLPNLSAEYGVTSAGGDYYHVYGDTLYIGLNSNNTSGTSHETFIRQAVAANANVKWKIVNFHHSIYSSASHSKESDILGRRAAFFPVFDACDIDMVIMGHDHCYTRSYQMLGDIPQKMIFNSMQKYRFWFFLFSVASLIIIGVFSFSMNRFIQRPINKLINAFQRLENGDMSFEIQHAYDDEIENLYQHFNGMIKKLDLMIKHEYLQEIMVKRAELKQLQSQINPHFLYNSFFILYTMTRRGEYEMLEKFELQLGEYFQFLTRNASDEVPLSREVEHARTYCEIQSLRFSNRIQISFDTLPPEYAAIAVPRLILQPIVENAFEHGLESKEAGGLLRISFENGHDFLDIVIEDNGDGLSEMDVAGMQNSLVSEGNAIETTGTVNIHKRIQLKFQSGSGLMVSRGGLGGLKVVIHLVLQEEKDGSDTGRG